MTQTPPEPDFADPNTLARPKTDPDHVPEVPEPDAPLRDDSGDIVPDTD